MRLLIGLCLMMLLSGCFAAAVVEKRGVSTAAADSRIGLEISERWFRHSLSDFEYLSVTSYNRRVLITGEVNTEAQRAEAIRLAWQVPGIREVINEIRVGEVVTTAQGARDEAINAELDSRLTFNPDIQFRNYATQVRNGIVYVMGIATTPNEVERVLTTARKINGVRRVVSYIEQF